MKNNIPAGLLGRHLCEVKRLIKGEAIEVKCPKYNIIAYLVWNTEKDVDIEVYRIIPKNATRKQLISSILNDLLLYFDEAEEDNYSKIQKRIKSSQGFKQFQKRIKKICAEADACEKKYDFIWQHDVLDVIELENNP